MKQYTLIENPIGGNSVQRNNEDGSISYIPIDPANSDYQAYLKSLEDEA
jgi:hypothetical protein